MARWEPTCFEAEDIAVRRLISAHPEEYERLLSEANAELPAESCRQCTYLGAAALELADLLGHDSRATRCSEPCGPTRSAAWRPCSPPSTATWACTTSTAKGWGLTAWSAVHDRVRQLERTAHAGDPAPLTLQELRPRTARPRGGACP
ncbi:hypothetical protein [Streptomyces sp. NPDC002553]|uniref:hypothetical protein n=1 Tax=Streptomyces sp. NPDC002553 TaxID=3154417 RepID=UPI0033285D7F